eukprot:scaffold327205_cov54-Tisochrysis_lutea.AAC.1
MCFRFPPSTSIGHLIRHLSSSSSSAKYPIPIPIPRWRWHRHSLSLSWAGLERAPEERERGGPEARGHGSSSRPSYPLSIMHYAQWAPPASGRGARGGPEK